MKIHHIMKDGSQAESLSGHKVRIAEAKDAYRAIKEGEKNELQDPQRIRP